MAKSIKKHTLCDVKNVIFVPFVVDRPCGQEPVSPDLLQYFNCMTKAILGSNLELLKVCCQ